MSEYKKDIVTFNAIHLLEELIAIPSLSREENNTADTIELFLKERNIDTKRVMNNVWCVNQHFDPAKPSILLNSHHDTVPPNTKYTNDPYLPKTSDGKLYGLGSTDAGASLVSLMAAFLYFYEEEDLNYNLVFAASAEEEISGSNGIEKLFSDEEFKLLFTHTDSFAIVGEPTALDLAIAEKGLLVLDCTVHGTAGHAAREEGDNAIYKAMKAIDWVKNYHFEKVSELLGEVKMTVTSIQTENKAHNVVPATCSFVVDLRITELYTHEEIISVIKENVEADIKPRSIRLLSSSINPDHPIVKAGIELGRKTYGSPTLSDQALIPLPSLKCGPGNSAQSHSADEFIAIADIEDGVGLYINLLQLLINHS
jgi:acetylornithine deacetylase